MTQLSTSRIPGGFTEKTARVNGVTFNYATGGTGPAVVLLHGYPQTWYMWQKVMPGGEGALGQAIPDQMELYAGDVTGAVFPCGHWVAEESPELLLKHLLPFLG